MVLLTQVNGVSKITENIFENRFMHVPELKEWEQTLKLETKVQLLKALPNSRSNGYRPKSLCKSRVSRSYS